MPKIIKKTKKTSKEPEKPDKEPLYLIDRDTVLSRIMEYPLAEDILRKYNFPCLSCPMAKFELETLTLGQVSGAYGLDLENMLKDLNAALKVYTKKES
jgi:hypothetical protein